MPLGMLIAAGSWLGVVVSAAGFATCYGMGRLLALAEGAAPEVRSSHEPGNTGLADAAVQA